jgi:hypothetical protein
VNAEVIEFAGNGAQARFQIAQTLAMSELCKGHAQPLIPAGKPAQAPTGAITTDTSLKFTMRNDVH